MSKSKTTKTTSKAKGKGQREFGGRLRPPKNEPLNYATLVELPNKGMAFVYQRLSSHEQVKKSVYSIKAQDALADLAREDGYPDHLIYVGKRDLGISGTLGREDRPELAYLIECVEAGKVEAVYTVHISRLYRDQTLINALSLGELFKEHNVIIVTPQMRLNLKDKMHMRLFRMEVERAADELELMAYRMIGAQTIKAKSGFYAGEPVPTGYVVDEHKTLEDGRPNPEYHSYMVHEPHAQVVRKLFELMTIPTMTPTRTARYCDEHAIVFLPLPPELNTGVNRKGKTLTKQNSDGSGRITAIRVRTIVTNPAYIGLKIWGGEIVGKSVYPPIIDEATFWAVQKRFGKTSRPKLEHDPLPLAGLIYCGNHDIPRRMTYANRIDRFGTYRCADNGLVTICCEISSPILDGPICEAVISQLTLPGLVDKVLNQLTSEYEQAKEQAASYKREMRRLETEIENLRGNLSSGVMSATQLKYIDDEIEKRLARIGELADLEKRPIGAAVGQPVLGKEDIELVRDFLGNLGSKWETHSNGLKNAFLRLLLDQVIIWPGDLIIKVRLVWRIGLEQELVIYRPVNGNKLKWTEAELDILQEHYATSDRDWLLERLPGRNWQAILDKASQLGLQRKITLIAMNLESDRYTPEHDSLIRSYYSGEIDLAAVMAATGRTEMGIIKRAQRLGLKKAKRRVTWEWVGNPQTDSRPGQKEPAGDPGHSSTACAG